MDQETRHGLETTRLTMDPRTRTFLEGTRRQVPRYLFRGWHASPGGDYRLNNETTITPRYFLHSANHPFYDFSRQQFTYCFEEHVQGGKFFTPFSSWTPLLSLAMAFCRDDYETGYISIIDTIELWESNPAFPCSELEHLEPESGVPGSVYEYLVWGKIEGPFHRAVPIKAFLQAQVIVYLTMSIHTESKSSSSDYVPGCEIKKHPLNPPVTLTGQLVESCRLVGMEYGALFSGIVTLAIIARLMTINTPVRLVRERPVEQVLIANAIRYLPFRGDWRQDWDAVGDLRDRPDWMEVGQLFVLMSQLAPVPCCVPAWQIRGAAATRNPSWYCSEIDTLIVRSRVVVQRLRTRNVARLKIKYEAQMKKQYEEQLKRQYEEQQRRQSEYQQREQYQLQQREQYQLLRQIQVYVSGQLENNIRTFGILPHLAST